MEEALGRSAQPVMTQRGRVVAVFPLDWPEVTRPRFDELPTAHWRRGWGGGGVPLGSIYGLQVKMLNKILSGK